MELSESGRHVALVPYRRLAERFRKVHRAQCLEFAGRVRHSVDTDQRKLQPGLGSFPRACTD